MKKWLFLFVLLLVLSLSGFISIRYWPYVFAKTVEGELIEVQRVDASTALLGTRSTKDKDLFSFAIAVRSIDGEIFTSSSEDRQWAVAHKGQCAQVKIFPYPPWELSKGGTYFNARLVKLKDCFSVDPAPENPATQN